MVQILDTFSGKKKWIPSKHYSLQMSHHNTKSGNLSQDLNSYKVKCRVNVAHKRLHSKRKMAYSTISSIRFEEYIK